MNEVSTIRVPSGPRWTGPRQRADAPPRTVKEKAYY
jgi:hypothetical protein